MVTVQPPPETHHFCVYPQGAPRKNDHLHLQTHIFRLELVSFRRGHGYKSGLLPLAFSSFFRGQPNILLFLSSSLSWLIPLVKRFIIDDYDIIGSTWLVWRLH